MKNERNFFVKLLICCIFVAETMDRCVKLILRALLI